MADNHLYSQTKAEFYLDQFLTLTTCGALAIVGIAMFALHQLEFIVHPQLRICVCFAGISILILVAIRIHGLVRPMKECRVVYSDGLVRWLIPSDTSKNNRGGAHWRQILLLLPVLLFLFRLPNEGLAVQVKTALSRSDGERADFSEGMDLRTFYALANSNLKRFDGKMISLLGKFSGEGPNSYRLFENGILERYELYRFVILDISAPSGSERYLKHIQQKKVKATGRVTFISPGNELLAVMQVQLEKGEILANLIEEVQSP